MVEPSMQSTERPDNLSRNFSEQLKGAFNLGGDLPVLSQKIEQTKKAILTERHELHDIEARIEATEEALARAGAGAGVSDSINLEQSTSDPTPTQQLATSSFRQPPPVNPSHSQELQQPRTANDLRAPGHALSHEPANGSPTTSMTQPTPSYQNEASQPWISSQKLPGHGLSHESPYESPTTSTQQSSQPSITSQKPPGHALSHETAHTLPKRSIEQPTTEYQSQVLGSQPSVTSQKPPDHALSHESPYVPATATQAEPISIPRMPGSWET